MFASLQPHSAFPLPSIPDLPTPPVPIQTLSPPDLSPSVPAPAAAPPAPLPITLLSSPRTLHSYAAHKRTLEVTRSEGSISMVKLC